MDVTKAAKLAGIAIGLAVAAGCGGWGQAKADDTSAGPGRIVCSSATACVVEIGTPASIRYKVDPAGLGDADKTRLKTCTAKASPPCIATVTGPEDKSVVKAKTIKFYN